MDQKDLLCNYFHHTVHTVMFNDSEELLIEQLVRFSDQKKE